MIVKNKETGLLCDIRPQAFDPSYYEKVNLVETPEPVEELTGDLNELLDAYEAKYGKRLVGKWAKDAEWIKSKL